MQFFQDIATLLTNAGLPPMTSLLLCIMFFLVGASYKYFRSELKAISEKIDTIKTQVEPIHGIVKAFNDSQMDHILDTKKMADEELWKHCPVERCPNIQKVINFLEQISREIKEFSDTAKESRGATQASISDVSAKIDTFIHNLGGEFIATLRDLRK